MPRNSEWSIKGRTNEIPPFGGQTVTLHLIRLASVNEGKYMFKKFISGILFGAGFIVGAIIIGNTYAYFNFNESTWVPPSENTTDQVPSITKPNRYLGSSAIHSGDFTRSGNPATLTEGPGEITGMVMANEAPVNGLRLRLLLNGSVKSKWAVSDQSGKYSVSVPFGKYRIDGFDLDSESANVVLKNKINSPIMDHSTGEFSVSEGNPAGQGLTFKFTDPVIKTTKNMEFSMNEPVIVEWEDFPNANAYFLRIKEKDEANGYDWNTVFDRRVTNTSFDMQQNEVKLKAGKYYQYSVTALVDGIGGVSKSVERYNGFDFQVIDKPE